MSKLLSNYVTWKGIIFLLAGFAVFMIGTTAKQVDAAQEAVSKLEAKVDQNKLSTDAGMAEVRKDLKAIYDYLLTNQRQPRLESAQ